MPSNATTLFEQLQAIKDGKSSASLFKEYCRDVLSSVEGVHFDYKEKQDTRNADLAEPDKRNLCKAISGFANTGGGVLIWGVSDHSPPRMKPIMGVDLFLRNMLQIAAHTTDPPVPGVDGIAIPANTEGAGYAVVFVPESQLPPHRVALRLAECQGHYYIRAGSSFAIAAHAQLEDMFGRRPHAKLVVKAREEFRTIGSGGWLIAFDVINDGRGTARNVCLEFDGTGGFQVDANIQEWLFFNSNDSKTGKPRLLFSPRADVIHPGMAFRFRQLRLGRRSALPGTPVQIPCIVYCDDCAPANLCVEGILSSES